MSRLEVVPPYYIAAQDMLRQWRLEAMGTE